MKKLSTEITTKKPFLVSYVGSYNFLCQKRKIFCGLASSGFRSTKEHLY